MKNYKGKFIASACLLAAFALWTALLCIVDVRAIGPQDSSVGFAALNGFFHRCTGVHLNLYVLTDWLSLVPVGVMLFFAALGLMQWIRRGHILRVDFSIRALGIFYLAVLAVYLLFEEWIINFRPVLLNGILEASYPSSTTVLVLCVMSTAALNLRDRIRKPKWKEWICGGMHVYSALMVLGRMISGVHWISDIIGGILLSAALVLLYAAVCARKKAKDL